MFFEANAFSTYYMILRAGRNLRLWIYRHNGLTVSEEKAIKLLYAFRWVCSVYEMACNSYFKNRQTKKELFADINMTAAMHIEKADCWFLFKGEVINAQEHIFGRFVFDIYVQMLVDIGFITRYKDDEPYFKINKKYRERWCIPTNMELAYPIEYMFGVRKKDLIRAN